MDIMRILILGNGFDLAHKLPTRYSEFLEFCKKIYDDKDYDNSIYVLINENIWFRYLHLCYKNGQVSGKDWIDFEKEISYIISYLDLEHENLDEHITQVGDSYSKCKPATKPEFWQVKQEILSESKEDYKKNIFWNLFQTMNYINDGYRFVDLRRRLFDELEKLIMALDIYLTDNVEKIDGVVKMDLFTRFHPSHVVSFNYTHTYQKLYGNIQEWNYYYIHGECNEEANPGACKMVLGIDEYLEGEKRDKNTNYSIFKKYVQRIQNNTYIDVNRLFQDIDNYMITIDTTKSGEPKIFIDKTKMVEILFYGHSLNVTDKDMLFKILSVQAVKITIYCLDKYAEAEYIENIIKIIGKDEFITKMETQAIQFVVLPKYKEIQAEQ